VPYSISAFFPAYNDAGTIASMVVSTDRTLRSLPAKYPSISDDYEIIVVNDGSADHTGEVLDELAGRYPRLKVITHPKNRGYGGALRTGFGSSTRDLVFYTDGDAQYDPRELERLIAALRDDVDMVQGYKIQRHDPLNRIIIGKLYHLLVNFMFDLRMRDVDCDFRLIRRSVFERVSLESDSGIICVELMTRFRQAGGVLTEEGLYGPDPRGTQKMSYTVERTLSATAQLTMDDKTAWFLGYASQPTGTTTVTAKGSPRINITPYVGARPGSCRQCRRARLTTKDVYRHGTATYSGLG
jgi:glycosyltransferase involved in cell wall biosynthesis